MYFLSYIDQKKLLGRILPTARSAGISDELRGWSWNKPPLKPLYEARIPMYSVCSKYCPTARDVFLDQVLHVEPKPNENVILGVALHRTVGAVINAYLEGLSLSFDGWYDEVLRAKGITAPLETIRKKCRRAWDFVAKNCEGELAKRRSEQPYASERDLLATALPFLVEHKISGELLGLSGLLSIDCYDYLRGIVFDLKATQDTKEWYRLAPTGYAIVLESVYEIPVDVGCVVYAWFQGSELRLKRDLFFINDDLRSWWVEERDAKLSMVAQRKEPGIAAKCPEECIYWEPCRGDMEARV